MLRRITRIHHHLDRLLEGQETGFWAASEHGTNVQYPVTIRPDKIIKPEASEAPGWGTFEEWSGYDQ